MPLKMGYWDQPKVAFFMMKIQVNNLDEISLLFIIIDH